MLKLRDIVRCGHVVRWSSVKHKRPQFLAEHLYMVTIISRALARSILTKEYYTPEMQILLADYCLNHDLPEILTGDFSSVAKRKMEDSLGEKADIFKKMDYEILPILKTLENKMEGTPLKHIAKLADWADAIVYLQQEGEDNSEIKTTKKILESFVEFLPEGDSSKENLAEKMNKYFAEPISHSHGIELKLKNAYFERVEQAAKEFPEFEWGQARMILDELENGENSSLSFEY